MGLQGFAPCKIAKFHLADRCEPQFLHLQTVTPWSLQLQIVPPGPAKCKVSPPPDLQTAIFYLPSPAQWDAGNSSGFLSFHLRAKRRFSSGFPAVFQQFSSIFQRFSSGSPVVLQWGFLAFSLTRQRRFSSGFPVVFQQFSSNSPVFPSGSPVGFRGVFTHAPTPVLQSFSETRKKNNYHHR